MTINFVITALDMGGAQRVLSVIVEYLSGRNYKIRVFSLYSNKAEDFFNISRHADVVYLDLERTSTGLFSGAFENIKRIMELRKSVFSNNPDIVVSFLSRTNVLVLLSGFFKKIPVIVSDHIDPKLGEESIIWKILRNFSYRFSTKVVVLTERASSYYLKYNIKNIEILPNPISVNTCFSAGRNNTKILISFGRMTHQKGFDILLKAFKNIAIDFPEWKLRLLGDGPLFFELRDLSISLNIQNQVEMIGKVINVHSHLTASDIFVLPSRYEGFPMALCEAMACGLPCIAADCPTGPREIVRNGVDGVLVPPEDVDHLANAMRRLMSDPDIRNSLGEEAKKVTLRFGRETVMRRWEDLFEQILKQ